LGSVALAAGDPVVAEKRLTPAVQALRELGAHAAAAHATVLLARSVAMQGRRDEAQELLLGLDAQASARLASEIALVRDLLRTPEAPAHSPAPPTRPAAAAVLETTGPSR